MLSINPNTTLK